MGNKKSPDKRAKQAGKKGQPPPRPQKVVVIVTTILGGPTIEEVADGRHVVFWMDVQGHGRIKVRSTSAGVYRASAVDPGAGAAAEAGAATYCEQHAEELQKLYGQLIAPVAARVAS